jgi:anti-sigma B factor antagonist
LGWNNREKEAVAATQEPESGPHRIQADLLTIEVRSDGATASLGLSGELDLASAPALSEEIERLFSGEAEALVLDLERLTFIDSTGLQCLVRAARYSKANGNRLSVRGASADVEHLITLTGIDKILPPDAGS